MHCISGILNKDARQHIVNNGVIFFITIGEKNYDRVKGESVWTNYDIGLYAEQNQISYYSDVLVEGASVTVYGSGIIPSTYESKKTGEILVNLKLIDARLKRADVDKNRVKRHEEGIQQVNQALQPQAAATQNFEDLDDTIPF